MSEELNKTAASAALRCLLGCSIAELVGMIATTAFGWSNTLNIVSSIVLAFAFGYSLSRRPLVGPLGFKRVMKVALASDTTSIATMELAANGFALAMPGAINAGVTPRYFG
jgi:hypothetical protein